MDRRVLIAGGLLLATQPGIAQPKTQRDDDLQYAQSIITYGAAALDMAKLGVTNSSSEEVRIFAQDEVAEQEGLAAVLRPLFDDTHSVPPPQVPKQDVKAWMIKLREAKGKEFDRLFVEAQLGVHGELLQAQEAFLAKGQDKTLRAVAMLAKGHISEHTGRLARLQQSLS
ncbi:hypothetical protein ASE63_25015 [Bosea sp. Root381]|uniref:DUF4142 domain-containing protein n=1 Tax=Bosea sp. Root381 TaxID=1736524 RepID=UPI0006FAF106|nr:DUF4142 domain-containing protein [Bosea sp. Root381]KRE05029.1 hypothetical protein ASE63_25015 [Bosea sp. Root381]